MRKRDEKDMKTRIIDDFELRHIFDCGQAFRWEKVAENEYIGVSGEKVLRISQDGAVVSYSATEKDFEEFWFPYFDLNANYGQIKKTLIEKDASLADAIAFGSGIRLLNQEPFEMLITFILSANNHIPRIRSLVKKLCENYGNPIEHPWRDLVGDIFTFPTPEALASAKLEDLRGLGLGYRDRYVLESAKKVAEQPDLLGKIQKLSYEEGKKELLGFSGVGPKVADCILLFSAGKHEAFPIDTWIKKTLERRYNLSQLSNKALEAWADNVFGELKGYAQQYMFFFEREKQNRVMK